VQGGGIVWSDASQLGVLTDISMLMGKDSSYLCGLFDLCTTKGALMKAIRSTEQASPSTVLRLFEIPDWDFRKNNNWSKQITDSSFLHLT